MWNALKLSSTHRAASHSGHKNSLLPSSAFVTHYTPLCWPGFFFSVSGILSGNCLSTSHGTFWSVQWWPWNFLTLPLACSISSACTSSTLNLKWSILVCPEFVRHITIQFRTAILSNLLNSFMYHLAIFFLSKRVCVEMGQDWISKSLDGSWYVPILSLLLKCIKLQIDTNRSIE